MQHQLHICYYPCVALSFTTVRKITHVIEKHKKLALSLIPPTGNTRPLNVISPVIAVSDLTFLWLKSETNAVTKVTPAEGPSLGTAPAGKCICISRPSNRLMPSEAASLRSADLALTYKPIFHSEWNYYKSWINTYSNFRAYITVRLQLFKCTQTWASQLSLAPMSCRWSWND